MTLLSKHIISISMGFSLISVCCATDSPILKNTVNNTWYKAGKATAQRVPSLETKAGKAKNIILFVGDGMGVSTVTASRILEGQQRGETGEENSLAWDTFPHTGLIKTYNTDAQTPDSAGTAVAMVTGVKTDKGVLGVDEGVEYGKCNSVKGHELLTALELAEIAGKSTGIVSTARITHATPAATYAKSASRNWEDDSDMPKKAKEEGCIDIATQLIEFKDRLNERTGASVNGMEVIMGGGRRHFLPKDKKYNSADNKSKIEGDRKDGKDLTEQWKKEYPQGNYVIDQKGFDAINTEETTHLLGLFNESHMHYESDRKNDKAGEPSLTEMTKKAIDILDNNDKGYFLMVESGRIDHAHHAGNAYNALNDTIEFSNAVHAAVEATNQEDTLILVTADHSHVFTIAGYPKRGNPILGKVVEAGKSTPALAADGKPYTTLGYTNGRGFAQYDDETNADIRYDRPIDAGRVDITNIDTTKPGYHQEALIPLDAETHAGEDVGLAAIGPGAALVSGTNEQNYIFHIMDYMGGLRSSANHIINKN